MKRFFMAGPRLKVRGENRDVMAVLSIEETGPWDARTGETHGGGMILRASPSRSR